MRNKEPYYHIISAPAGITDLPDGILLSDAVNVSQLNNAISNIPIKIFSNGLTDNGTLVEVDKPWFDERFIQASPPTSQNAFIDITGDSNIGGNLQVVGNMNIGEGQNYIGSFHFSESIDGGGNRITFNERYGTSAGTFGSILFIPNIVGNDHPYWNTEGAYTGSKKFLLEGDVPVSPTGDFIYASPVTPQVANINITGTISSPRIYTNYFEDLNGDGFTFTPVTSSNILFNMGNNGVNYQRIDFGSSGSGGKIDLNFNNNTFTLLNTLPLDSSPTEIITRNSSTGELQYTSVGGIVGNYVTLDTTQTVTGSKTFNNFDGTTTGTIYLDGGVIRNLDTAYNGKAAYWDGSGYLNYTTIPTLLGYTPENVANKGIANGYASLDSSGKIVITQIPDTILGALKWGGTYNGSTVTASSVFPELNGQPLPDAADYEGVFFVSTADYTEGGIDFKTGDWIIAINTSWSKVDNSDSVMSVNGDVGNVTVDDVPKWNGLFNDFNTSISTGLTAIIGTNGTSTIHTFTSAGVQAFLNINDGSNLNNNASSATLWGGAAANFSAGDSASPMTHLVGFDASGVVQPFSSASGKAFLNLNDGSTLNNNISGSADKWNGLTYSGSVGAASLFMAYDGTNWGNVTPAVAKAALATSLQDVLSVNNNATTSPNFNNGITVGNGSKSISQYIGDDGSLRFYNNTVAQDQFILGENGNVGLGTTSPQAKLHVNNGTNRNLWLRPDGSGNGSEFVSINDDQSVRKSLAFSASSFNFDSGNVGINTTLPTQKLDVNGYVRSVNGFVGSTDLNLFADNSSISAALIVKNDNNVLIGTTTNDGVNKLQVNGSAIASGLTIKNASLAAINFIDGANAPQGATYNAYNHTFKVNGTTALTLDNLASNARFASKITWGSGTYTAGDSQIFNTTSDGTMLIPKTGTSTDFALTNGAGQTVMGVPTGTLNADFQGILSWGTGSGVGNKGEIFNTSVLGTVLLPKIGSSNDFSLYNGSAALAMSIPTGTVNSVFAGDLTSQRLLISSFTKPASTSPSVTTAYTVNLNGQVGADNIATTGFATAGTGERMRLRAGNGGNSVTSSGTKIGGTGGGIDLIAGDAGLAPSGTSGIAGDALLQAGAIPTGAGTPPRAAGDVFLKGGTNNISNGFGGSIYLVPGYGNNNTAPTKNLIYDGNTFLGVNVNGSLRGAVIIGASITDGINDFQVTGNSLFTGAVKVTSAPVVSTDVIRYTDLGTGWAVYNDTTYTSGSPFVINSGTTSTLPNDAGTTLNSQLPLGVTSFYDSSTSKITPQNDGDYYITTIRFKATTTAPTAGYLDFGIDIGGALGVQFKETKIFAKGAAIEHQFSITVPMYSASTFIANGGLVKLTAGNGNISVYEISFHIDRTHKAK